MNETTLGYLWDVSWENDTEYTGEVIVIDAGDSAVTLTRDDLLEMLESL